MRWGWAMAMAVFALAAVVVLADAVRDLAALPSFAAVLRLVVETVAAVVVSLALWGRARGSGRRPGH